jgi:gluconolactonase
MLYAGGEAGQVYRIDPDARSFAQLGTTSGFVLGLCLDGHGLIYLCDMVHAAIMRMDSSGAAEPYCDSAGGRRLICPNWPAFAPDGSLWFSDSGTPDVNVCDGRLIRVPPSGGAGERVDVPALHYPNGLAFESTGDLLLLETFTPRLRRLNQSGLSTVVTLPGVVPDGLAVDAAGGVIVACYYPFRLLYVQHDVASVLLDDPTGLTLPMPTNVAFFGCHLERLAISALGGWTIGQWPAPTPGASLLYPRT